jgi:hypothetical protein
MRKYRPRSHDKMAAEQDLEVVSCITLAAATMIHSLVDDSLSIVRFELGQLRHLLHIIDRGIRAALGDLQVEIEQARDKRTDGHPLDDQKDSDDMMAVADLSRYSVRTQPPYTQTQTHRASGFRGDVLQIPGCVDQ